MERKEIVGKDGLLHCSVCGEAVEMIVPFPTFREFGTAIDKKIRVMCSCQKKVQDDYEKKQKQADELRKIEMLRQFSLIDEKLAGANLSTFVATNDNARLLKIVKNYIENFDTMYNENHGLLFWGPVGTGKSYAAATIANELLQMGISVVMTSFIKILNESGTYGSDNGDVDKINNSKLLIIDDLGAERGTDYALERVYDIIDNRYRSNKPIILTTNLTMDQMKDCDDIRYNRIYDRIFEMCYPVKVTGFSWRKREAASRYAETKKILEGL